MAQIICSWQCCRLLFCNIANGIAAKNFFLKLPNSVRKAKNFLEAMLLAMLPTKSRQHCQDQMIPAIFFLYQTVNFTIPFKMQLSSLLWCVCSHQLCGWNQITSHSADNSSSFDNWSSTCPLLELSWLKEGSLRPFNGAEDGKGSSI